MPVGWFALEALSTPASSVLAPDWTSPSWSEPGVQLTDGVWKEIPSFLVCVVTSLLCIYFHIVQNFQKQCGKSAVGSLIGAFHDVLYHHPWLLERRLKSKGH